MTTAEKKALLAFAEKLSRGPSQSDCEGEYDFGFAAGQETAYENLRDDFNAVLVALKMEKVK